MGERFSGLEEDGVGSAGHVSGMDYSHPHLSRRESSVAVGDPLAKMVTDSGEGGGGKDTGKRGRVMKAAEFCYWLQGYFELRDEGKPEPGHIGEELSHAQVQMIQRHLALVFKHDLSESKQGVDQSSLR